MDPYISYSADRRATWVGHPSKLGVRRAIDTARRGRRWSGPRDLIIFSLEHTPSGRVYVEIPPEDWTTEFAD
ncbi:hypothetical protein ACIF6L_26435 [Kitasatospora sp. NPDC086009]|uniref:hypothetical protein n=1 Tax=unclassified Kitasatospora TaxID=2633591 RepID=UPI0037CAE6BB